MGSRPKRAMDKSMRKTRRRLNSGRRFCRAQENPKTVISDKLEALKSLIPAPNGDQRKTDQLFQETADYIVHLRSQVLVLQRLISLYGSSSSDKQNAV